MNKLILSLLCLLVGCRHVAPVTPPPVPIAATPLPVIATAASVPPTRPVTTANEPRSRQQAQIIEALQSQNEALAAQLAVLQTATESKTASVAVEPASAGASPPVRTVPPEASETESVLAPNAEGLIDLTGTGHAGPADEPVNPFAVRTIPADQTREITLKVGGIILGATPSALVNNRLVQAGDRIEAFAVERIESDAVLVRTGAHLLRLPVSTVPARVRLAL